MTQVKNNAPPPVGGTTPVASTPVSGATPQTSGDVTELEMTDVVMVGIGASGGIAAHVLTDAGLKVVAIEAGPRLDKEDFLAHYDELENHSFFNWTGETKFNKELPTWRRTPDSEPEPYQPIFPMANMVGGTSVHYATMSWRFRMDDFNIRSSTVEKYGEEALPEGSAVADWAVTYDEMEPYYEKVEQLIGVSGKGGENPFESPRKNNYPLPPLQRFGGGQYVSETMTELGYHPFPTPSGILSEEYDGRPACTYCGYCVGQGCWNDSKSSTLVSAIPRAEDTGNLEIRTNSRVFRVHTDDNGRATGVEYRGEDGKMYVQPAKLVILSAYMFENIRRLLLFANEQFPNGLANNAGLVGKYFSGHSYLAATGVFSGKNFNRFSGSAGGQTEAIDDFNGDNFDHTGLGFIRGGVVTAGPSESMPIAGSRTIPPSVPQWGSEYTSWLRENANSVQSISIQLETLPYDDNFLDLDPEEVDEDGVPLLRITYDIKDNEKKAWEYIGPKLEEILTARGATETWLGDALPSIVTSHDVGGARAGDDPSTSVLDKYLLTHEIPNLAVLGGAGFASLTGYNPTQTIEAWAWLAAEHIAGNFDEITGLSVVSSESGVPV